MTPPAWAHRVLLWWPAIVAVLLALTSAPNARAATVSLRPDPDYGSGSGVDVLNFQASPGEENTVTVQLESARGMRWTFADATAPVVAVAPCRALDGAYRHMQRRA